VRSARGAYGLPKPVVLGYSNGANIGWSLLLQEPGALAGAILLRRCCRSTRAPCPI
jgi:phospholipase/carboxylesterase